MGTKREQIARPDLHRYQDYRTFLNDWVRYRKATEPKFSLRSLARESGVAVGYLSMILSGERKMLRETLEKLGAPLGLTPSERSYLELLRTVAESESPEARHDAVERLQRFRGYRENNAKEIEAYRYLTHWYYVAIREMVRLPDFEPDARWIQKRLRPKVSLAEVEEALRFLLASGFLVKSSAGKVQAPEKEILALGGVYKMGLQQFHREMLALASDALHEVPVEERDVTGYTIAVPRARLPELRELCFRFLRQVAKLEDDAASPDDVYHVAVAAVPLTKKEGK